ncbi:MAG: HAMP domain-containing sensor histidine kinase, partial [Nocardioides sp.]
MLHRLTGPLRVVLRLWQGSITARVLLSTVVLTALFVSAVGWFLLQQTRTGLLEARVSAVLAETANETARAQERLDSAEGNELDAARQRTDLVTPMIDQGLARGYGVLLSGPARTESGVATGVGTVTIYTPGLAPESLPDVLAERFENVSATAWTYGNLRTIGSESALIDGPAVVVGSQVKLPADGRTYTLYYFYPLQEQGKTLALVTRALLTAGVLLIVLIAGIGWLVTRQVVTPIRLARRSAERLAAGTLTERLKVKGSDDLARLATSFNQMAANLQRQIRQLEELSRVQRRFVSDVSHELRTPLTTVRMASEVLHDSRGDFDPSAARAAELLQVELDRFESLLGDLLEISRFDAGAAVLDLDEVDLRDVVQRVVDMMTPLAAQRGS